ncbi:MAG: hypothetical protein QXW79_02395 [Thermoplasmata archaeon]
MKEVEIAEKTLEKWIYAINENDKIFNQSDLKMLIQATLLEISTETPRIVLVDGKYVLPLEIMLRSVVQVILEKKRELNEITQQQFSNLSTLLGLGDFPEFLLKAKYMNKSYNEFKQSLYDDE